MGFIFASSLGLAVLGITLLGSLWLQAVSREVPEPYLDEVFHVRQAQVYCAGKFDVWDPKITTPPGLYLLSYAIYFVTGSCNIYVLRALNVGSTTGVCVLAYLIRQKLEATSTQSGGKPKWTVSHTALNVSLFPPLFFFSGLYYTDVASTFFVLLSYHLFLSSGEHSSNLSSSAVTVVAGVVALLFRQTNIFWVAIFPLGLSIVKVLKSGRGASVQWAAKHDTSFVGVCNDSWDGARLYDPQVAEAKLEDYFKTVVSIAVKALRDLPAVVLIAMPYVSLIAIFGGFVIQNGGVVLGDKSNHVATLHVTQMFYIWPNIFFFSFPAKLGMVFRSFLSTSGLLISGGASARPPAVPRVWVLASFIAIGLVVVHFNTIIHPFTLADNRHYVFYVFRILRRHPIIKYLAVPIYIMCGFVTIQSLGTIATKRDSQGAKKANLKSSTSAPSPRKAGPAPVHGVPVSFVLVWLATTALNLITAPLVEPRYFIVPWLMWRLHLPTADPEIQKPSQSRNVEVYSRYQSWAWSVLNLVQEPWFQLSLETLWYAFVNIATMYMFLARGFSWPQEPGNIQRFMW
ncbi:glycosyltransferase family 59 protein [Aulographum hederae CBS 113979]|uniref:Dol-P-Glc:Glc(2)Man(9)GlcNAc(2)-PP-Dol alpha-1,2-glucosyltransferase n=1 Tax=Aulographum hederae CBS 113979 TaxID=1176131 RepID=A0A6G1GQP5_9PEZI|nr:glycosyltransferase family 59 protein [Aulographum hederae CBS 113979]